jgi:hypothetical protein
MGFVVRSCLLILYCLVFLFRRGSLFCVSFLLLTAEDSGASCSFILAQGVTIMYQRLGERSTL